MPKPKLIELIAWDVLLIDKRVNVPLTYQVSAASPSQAIREAINRAKRDANLPFYDRSFEFVSCTQSVEEVRN
jgi:hypothetical protein